MSGTTDKRCYLPLVQILPDQRNVRRVYDHIEELAEDIHRNGLHQNLVVSRAQTNADPALDDYFTMAGERRLRALNLLVKQKRPFNPHSETGISMVPVVVKDAHDFLWVNMSENIQRRDVPVWHLGHRFIELLETGGYTQAQIGIRIGRPQGYVSMCCQIARGLASDVIDRLDKLRAFPIKDAHLKRLTELVTSTGEPDTARQLQFLEKLLRDPSSQSRTRVYEQRSARSEQKAVYARYIKLRERGSYKLTSEQEQMLHKVLQYLDGKIRVLRFD